MKDTREEMVIYLGRAVSKKMFRTFVYDHRGASKLVESWEDFEEAIQSGLWFAQPIALKESENKPKKKAKGV